jgi:hypothetical protein
MHYADELSKSLPSRDIEKGDEDNSNTKRCGIVYRGQSWRYCLTGISMLGAKLHSRRKSVYKTCSEVDGIEKSASYAGSV